jgi:hypothetical protein
MSLSAEARAGKSNAPATISSASEIFCGVFKSAYPWPAWPFRYGSMLFKTERSCYYMRIALLDVGVMVISGTKLPVT